MSQQDRKGWYVRSGSVYLDDLRVIAYIPDKEAEAIVAALRFAQDSADGNRAAADRMRAAGDNLADTLAAIVAVTAKANLDPEKLPAIKKWRDAR